VKPIHPCKGTCAGYKAGFTEGSNRAVQGVETKKLDPRQFSALELDQIKGRAIQHLIDESGFDVTLAWYLTVLRDIMSRGYEIRKRKEFKNEEV